MSPFDKEFNISLYNKLNDSLDDDEHYSFKIKEYIKSYLEKTLLRRYLEETSTLEEIQQSELSTILHLNTHRFKSIILNNPQRTDYFFLNVNQDNLKFATEIIQNNPELLIHGKTPFINRVINYYGASGTGKTLTNPEFLAYIIHHSIGDEKIKKEWFEQLTEAMKKTYRDFSANYPDTNNQRFLDFIPNTYRHYEKILINDNINNEITQEENIVKKRL